MATKPKKDEKWYTYVLKLQQGKYYVGKTKDIEERLKDHWANNGSKWTTKYKPIELENVYANYQTLDELRYTLIMMNCHGVDNVRGANFSSVQLTTAELTVIRNILDGEHNKCFYCHEEGHFVSACAKFARKSIVSRYYQHTNKDTIAIKRPRMQVESDDDDDDDDDDEDDDDDSEYCSSSSSEEEESD